MFIPKPSDNANFQIAPAGNHAAICYRLVDLGTQQATDFTGKATLQHKIMLSWELPEERMESGEPFGIHQRYNFSMHEKANLRKHLESWRGQAFVETDFGEGGFDLKNILGKPCLLGIVHEVKNGKTYDNITTIARMPKGMPAPAGVNPLVYVSLDPKEFNVAAFDALSENLKDTIRKSPEYAAMQSAATRQAEMGGGSDLDEQIPF